MKLQDITNISPGHPFRGAIPEKAGSCIRVVQLKDISKSGYIDWEGEVLLGFQQTSLRKSRLLQKSSGRNNNLMRQIGEHLVCAELGRRGITATPFSGNVPTFDVLATNAKCCTVPIQVKASSSNNWRTDTRTWMNLNLDPENRRAALFRSYSSIKPRSYIRWCYSCATGWE